MKKNPYRSSNSLSVVFQEHVQTAKDKDIVTMKGETITVNEFYDQVKIMVPLSKFCFKWQLSKFLKKSMAKGNG